MAKKAEKEKPKPVEVMKSVKIYYSDQEITNMARQMSYAIQEKEILKSEAKEKADAFKNQITAKETQITNLSNSVNLGYQMIQKTCQLVKNFDRQKREYWFDGKIVEEENLTSSDYQTELEMVEQSNKVEADRLGDMPTTEPGSEKPKGTVYEVVVGAGAGGAGGASQTIKAPEPVVLTEDQQKEFDDYVEMGDGFYKKKKYFEALKLYQAASKLDPSHKIIADKALKTQNWIDKLKENNVEV